MYTYPYLHVHTHIHNFRTCLYLRATLFDVYIYIRILSQYCATLMYTKKHVHIRTCKLVFGIHICTRVHTYIHVCVCSYAYCMI